MSLYTLRPRQNILADTHGYRAGKVMTTVVGAVEYMIQAPVMAARALLPETTQTPQTVLATRRGGLGGPGIEAGWGSGVIPAPSDSVYRQNVVGVPAPSDRFSQQFPAINALYEPLRTNVLDELNKLLLSFKRGANARDIASWIIPTNALRSAGWYGADSEAFKANSPLHAAKVLAEVQSLGSRLNTVSRTPVGNGFEAWTGPMPRETGEGVGPAPLPMAKDLIVDVRPQYTIAKPIFNRQFPAISALREPRRSELLNHINTVLYDYLTNTGTDTRIAGSSSMYGRITHTWLAAASKLNEWQRYTLMANWPRSSVPAPGITPAALAEVVELERKIRAVGNSGLSRWVGPWPREFGACRASYNEFLRATGWEGALPAATDCSIYAVTPATPKYTAVAGLDSSMLQQRFVESQSWSLVRPTAVQESTAAQANIPTGYTADTPVLYAGPPKPQFQYAGRPVATAHFGQKAYKLDTQFPFVSKIEEPCRSEILSILHQALDSIPRGKVAPWNVSKEFSGMRWWADAVKDLYSSKKWKSCIQTLTRNPDRIGARTEIVNTINEIRTQCINTIAKGEICVADSAYLPSVY